MKRILLSAYVCIPFAGTEPGYGWYWATHLAERGMDVRALVAHHNREKIEEYRRDHPELKIRFTYIDDGKSWLRKSFGARYALWHWKAARIARKLMETEGYDVAHHVTYGSMHVPSRLWKLGIPVVFGPVGGGQTAPESMMEYFGESRSKERLRTFFTQLLPHSPFHRHWFGKMGALLGSNRETIQIFRCLGRSDAQLVPDVALPDSFYADVPRTFTSQPDPVRLLWVGRILPRKALPLALDILARTAAPATLTIIGSGMEESKVREMIRIRGLDARVFWKPERIPWSEVREAYRRHDAFLFTSLRDSCGLQLLEAMALGLPVITLGINGARDLVPDDAGYKIPVVSKEQVIHDGAAAIDHFAALTLMEKNAMSRAAWKFAKSLTWTKRAEDAEKLYDHLLQSSVVRTTK